MPVYECNQLLAYIGPGAGLGLLGTLMGLLMMLSASLSLTLLRPLRNLYGKLRRTPDRSRSLDRDTDRPA